MSMYHTKKLGNALLIVCSVALLSACTSPKQNEVRLNNVSYSVASAYETSGVVAVPRYTRTIFSSTNF